MSSKQLPYFKWYPADAELDEKYSAMSDAELGFFHRCLNKAWRNGGLPSDPEERARVMRTPRKVADSYWERVGKCFVASEDDPSKLVNPRQSTERAAAIIKSANSSRAAKGEHSETVGSSDPRYVKRAERMVAAKKLGTHTSSEWELLLELTGSKCIKCGSAESIEKDHIKPVYLGGDDSILNLQPLCPSCNSAKGPESLDLRTEIVVRTLIEKLGNVTPRALGRAESGSESECISFSASRKKIEAEITAWFDAVFWPIYPRKKARRAGLKAAMALTTERARDVALAGLRSQIPEMLAVGARDPSKVPHAATWINGKRWEDELSDSPPNPLFGQYQNLADLPGHMNPGLLTD